ncbi:carbohydrate ABC transporter permease [Microbacterium sulfonylureivorans]|uniref:carbohydrate ABC transporter permease n=1 Tax=Microbacterium sulfonylureivorans TaxID=2486854 RepID=UPI0013E05E08|nr:sugar ABC transporter permease [Microbacterium sulfonylureivorans]
MTLRSSEDAVTSSGGHRTSVLARRRARTGFLLTVPALVLVVGVVVIPIGFALWISANRWPLFGEISFVGLDNYIRVFQDAQFWQSVGFTLLYTAVVTGPVLIFGYLLAAFVRGERPGTRLFRTLLFLPTVVGLSTLSFLWYVELRPNFGLVNVTLKALGITNGQTGWSLHWVTGLAAVSVLVIWFAVGTTMVLLLGGMQSIPAEIYEAARIDGVNGWQREMLITVPLVRRNLAMATVLSVIASFLAFQQFVILTNGGPGRETTTVVMSIFHESFYAQQLGSATAMGVVVMLIVAALTAIQLILMRERDA